MCSYNILLTVLQANARIDIVERFEFEFVLGKGEGGKREASLLREVK